MPQPTSVVSNRFRCHSQSVTDGIARVWLSGEIEISDAPEIDEALQAAQAMAAMVIFDARGVSPEHPALLNVATAAGLRAREAGHRLVILHDPSGSPSALQALGLQAQILSIHDEPAATPPQLGAADDFAVTTGEKSGRTVVMVRGELDLVSGPQLAHVLAALASDGRPIVLDLTALSFMDSTGIRLLLEAEHLARRAGDDFRMIPSDAVRSTLRAAGLRDHFLSAERSVPEG